MWHLFDKIPSPTMSFRHCIRYYRASEMHANTCIFESSLISAHLEKNCPLGVFSRSARLYFWWLVLRKKSASFPVQWASFPVQWVSFPSQYQEMGGIFWSGRLFLKKWSWQKLVPSEIPGIGVISCHFYFEVICSHGSSGGAVSGSFYLFKSLLKAPVVGSP